jgi:hypothetical protein
MESMTGIVVGLLPAHPNREMHFAPFLYEAVPIRLQSVQLQRLSLREIEINRNFVKGWYN